MKEININGAFMKCYPLCAAQRLHYYTVKYSPEQVLCIGTGLYVKQDVDFNILKKAIYEKVYGKPLDYSFEPSDIAGWVGGKE